MQDWESVNPSNKIFTQATKKTLPYISIIGGGVLLCLICLYVTCRGSGENDALEFERTYELEATKWLTDYDKENPLT